jgi:superfamily II RNA helicase
MSANEKLSLDLQEIYPFPLDEFQKNAIDALNRGQSVVVCAPTGSGKTLIGEYAIHRALASGKRVFYTTPLKALSNQKYRDFEDQFGTSIGLITGDIVINPEAAIVVMTTEIFRNMLYETPIGQVGTSLEGVQAVVLDECHYLSDRSRGTVWEESIIYCPNQIQLVALSATIGNPEEFTDWINFVRTKASQVSSGNLSQTKVAPDNEKASKNCVLINSDYRPVPLQFLFCNKKGIFPLLNAKKTGLNPQLKSNKPKVTGKQKRTRREDCPTTVELVKQLHQKQLLPAIYVIFSRKGCDRAVEELNKLDLVTPEESQEILLRVLFFLLAGNPELQEQLLTYLNATNPILREKFFDFLSNRENADVKLIEFLLQDDRAKQQILQFLASNSEIARTEQVEPLTRGIAAHHAGLLPAWKELVETLFELGLVKIVFATATLSAGINMPARTTVISALSKRTDEGHCMLTPSEFLQIAGRAGRRGKDTIGYVVTMQTPFEGSKEAAYLATADAEPLRSWFTPSYGMVLNLLQKYSIEEAKDLLERSFAEYLAQSKLVPEQKAISALTSELAKLDIELAGIDPSQLHIYEKLRERQKEEKRLLEILQQQSEVNRKKEIAPLIPKLQTGKIVSLKGKHIRTTNPIIAVVVGKVAGSGQADDLLCLSEDNRWYVASNADIQDILTGSIPNGTIDKLDLSDLATLKLGKSKKGNEETKSVSETISSFYSPPDTAEEIREQQQRLDEVQTRLDSHPLEKSSDPISLLKRHRQRVELQEQLHRSQIKYQKHQLNKSYYWEDFLNLIEVLREFNALDVHTPTPFGQVAATIRSDNELWIALAFTSGELERLEPQQLAAAIAALITETPRPDSWCEYLPSQAVIEALGVKKRDPQDDLRTSSLRELRPHLFQTQRRYGVSFPVWREYELVGVVEQWAQGQDWQELCASTNLDEGDIVRMLRRTVDLLWQIPQIPDISEVLENHARLAIAGMKRFPV